MTQPDSPQQPPEQQPPPPTSPGQPSDKPKPGDQQQDLNAPQFSQNYLNSFEAKVRREHEVKAQRDKELIEKGKEYEGLLADAQPLTEQLKSASAEGATKDATIAEKDLTIRRLQLAWESGLPPAIGRRVQGKTEDEIKADIESLKADLAASGAPAPGVPGLRPNPQQGVPSPDANRTGSESAGRDLWASRHGKKQDAAT